MIKIKNFKNSKKIQDEKFHITNFTKFIVIIIGLLLAVLFFNPSEKPDNVQIPENYMQVPEDYEISSGWTITSYHVVDEKLYDGAKIKIFDREGNSLGLYKSDFIKQLRIDGTGKVEDPEKSGKYLHYDYTINDGKTHYWADISLGAWNNELVPWTGDKPSVAVNPPLSQGTQIKFINLGPDSEYNPDWVNKLLRTKTFYADDKFYGFGENEKKIDVYVGLQKSREYGPESLLMHNVSIALKYSN